MTKHYKLKWHHFKDILNLVEEGHCLETQDDMPEKVRVYLFAEEQQFLEMRHKDRSTTASSAPPINIILPESIYQATHSGSLLTRNPALDTQSAYIPVQHLDVFGPRDKITDEYCAWQESQVEEPEQKAAYQEARQLMKDNYIDLGLIYRHPDPKKLIDLGIKIGAAEHIVYDIDQWKQCRKRLRIEEQG